MAHPDLVLQISTSLSTPKLARLSGLFLMPVLDYEYPCHSSNVGVVTHIYRDLTDGTWKLIEYHSDKKVLLGYCQRDSALAGAPWQLTAALGEGSIQIHSWSRSAYEIKQAQLATASCKSVVSNFQVECRKLALEVREIKELNLKSIEGRVDQLDGNNKDLLTTMGDMKDVLGNVKKRQLKMEDELAQFRERDRCRCGSPSTLRVLDIRRDKLLEGQSVLTGKRGRLEKAEIIMHDKRGVYASTQKGARSEFYRQDQVWIRDPCFHCRAQKKQKQG